MDPGIRKVVIDEGPTSYGAHVPELRGCAAVGESMEQTKALITEAIKLHSPALQAQIKWLEWKFGGRAK